VLLRIGGLPCASEFETGDGPSDRCSGALLVVSLWPARRLGRFLGTPCAPTNRLGDAWLNPKPLGPSSGGRGHPWPVRLSPAYDLFSSASGNGMGRRSGSQGKPAKAPRSKASKLKRHNAPEAVVLRPQAAQQISDWLASLDLGRLQASLRLRKGSKFGKLTRSCRVNALCSRWPRRMSFGA
jgi:hypothetical protein